MLRLNVPKLISNELKVFAQATRFSIPICYVVRSFVCKDLSHTGSSRFPALSMAYNEFPCE